MEVKTTKKAALMGVAGSNNAFSLSLYNLKAYAYNDPLIRKNWNISVIQHPLIGHPDQFEKKTQQHTEMLVEEKPDVVGFSCYMWNVKYFRLLAEKLKVAIPTVKIVFGGPEMSRDYVTEGNYDDFPMDFCISGEGEITFWELLKNITTGSPELHAINGLAHRESIEHPFLCNEKRETLQSLLDIPSPFLVGVVDDEVLFRKMVEANIETQRGCNLRCSYCIYHKDMKRISYSEVDRVIDEVRYVINKGVKRIRFVDANFSSNMDYAKTVMKGLIKNQFETRMFFELIPGFIDEELAALFAEFNKLYPWNEITLGIGVQTINLEVLKRMRRAIRMSKFEKTFELLQKYNLYAKIDLIIGLPGEDIVSIENTLEYMLEKLSGSQSHLLCCHIMRGLPGTELLDIAKEFEMQFTSEFEPHELFESSILPRQDMLKCLRRTAVIFRLVNHSGWANREFIYDRRSENTNIRDSFMDARQRLDISNLGLVDFIIDGLLEHLDDSSDFKQERFPYAENWWWSLSKVVVKDSWILEYLSNLTPSDNPLYNPSTVDLPLESLAK